MQGPEGPGAGDQRRSPERCWQDTPLATLNRGAASLAEAVLRPCIAAPGDTPPAHISCMYESCLGRASCNFGGGGHVLDVSECNTSEMHLLLRGHHTALMESVRQATVAIMLLPAVHLLNTEECY